MLHKRFHPIPLSFAKETEFLLETRFLSITITLAFLLLSTLLTLNFVGGAAHAQTDIYVDATAGDNKTGDGSAAKPYKTITFALAKSRDNKPDPWRVHLRPGSYDADPAKPATDREVFPLKLRKGMTLEGTTSAKECIIDAKHLAQSIAPIIDGTDVTDFVIRNLTIQNMNRTSGNGGGIELKNSTGTLEVCVIHNNNNRYAVWTNQSLTLIKNTFSDNKGYGLYVEGNFAGDVSSHTFINNSGDFSFYVTGQFTGDVSQNTFTNNSSGFYVGGTFSGNVTQNTFNNNSSGSGGGFYARTLSGNVTQNTFNNNKGGGFSVNAGTVEVVNNLFIGNTATANGSAVYTAAATTFKNNLFVDNGLSTVSAVWLSSDKCRFHNNIFSGMKVAIFENRIFDLPITHNIFHNVGVDIISQGGAGLGNDIVFWELLATNAKNNLDTDPLFVGGDDYCKPQAPPSTRGRTNSRHRWTSMVNPDLSGARRILGPTNLAGNPPHPPQASACPRIPHPSRRTAHRKPR